MHERGDHGNLAFHAQAHLPRWNVRVQAERVQQHPQVLVVAHAAHPFHHAQERRAGHAGGQRDLAGKVAHGALQLGGARPAILSVDGDRSGLRAREAHEVADGGGFPGSVRAQEAEAFSALHLEGHVEHAAAAAVVLRQMGNLYLGHEHHPLRLW